MTTNESESRYRDCFENTKYAIYVHDLNGRYTMVNKAGEALIGYTREEILQMNVSDIVLVQFQVMDLNAKGVG